MSNRLSGISQRILEVMKSHPEGISEGEIREQLRIPAADQANFGRRRRELNYHYVIGKRRQGTKVLYIYKGPRDRPRDTAPISLRLRAQALHSANGRCKMCGRTVETHGITFAIDHRIPREWGGKTEPENLWAICEDCNQGKKDYFEAVDTDWMRQVMRYESVHVRLGETLRAFGKEVPMDILEFVANQDDWKKRLRELRYLGWVIKSTRRKQADGKVRSYYRLVQATSWPKNPTAEIRKYELERAKRNRAI